MSAMRIGTPLVGEVFSWESQLAQYPRLGPRNITTFDGEVTGYDVPVKCVLYRDSKGLLRGIFNYYSVDYLPYEKAGNFLVLVDPKRRRQGIASSLLHVAETLYGPIDYNQQRYSPEGYAFMLAYRGLSEA